MTAREVAGELGISERTVRRWIGAGELPAEKHGGAFVVDLEAAREVHRRSRTGRVFARSSETAELRGRLLEAREQLIACQQTLVEEKMRSERLHAILYPPDYLRAANSQARPE